MVFCPKKMRYHMMITSSSDEVQSTEYSSSVKFINGVLYIEFYLDGASCDHLCNLRDFLQFLLFVPGGEYVSDELATMSAYENIRSHPTSVKMKRFNEVAERANTTLAEIERCLRTYAALPRSTWVNSAEQTCLLEAQLLYKAFEIYVQIVQTKHRKVL